MARKIADLLITTVLCAAILLLGAATAAKVCQMIDNGGGSREGRKAENAHTVEMPADNSLLLENLCCRLEELLMEDGALHINSMLLSPKEYDIWETLYDISQIGESGLSDEEWLLYQKLRWCRECHEEAAALPDYFSLLSDLNGILNKLPEIFYTWHFDTRQDVEAYGQALRQVPDLLGSLAQELHRQSGEGVDYPQSLLERQRQNCERQLAEESVFLEDYDRRIRSCDFLTEEEKENLIWDNRSYVEKSVWTSYREIAAILEQTRPWEEGHGLRNYPQGQEYYEYLLKATTGVNQPSDEMFSFLEGKRELVKNKISEIEQKNGGLESELFLLSAEEILLMLYERTEIQYPGFPRITYTIEAIPEKLNSTLYQAFYLKDARSGANYIYVGEAAREGTWLSMYQTLAHEALPGHMYCYNYPAKNQYPGLGEQIKCMGYSEGWRPQAELSAAAWLPGQELQEAYLKQFYEKLYDEIVLCQIDIGIHAMNWDLDDIELFSITAYGAGSREASEVVMETLSQNPGAYQVYVIGFYEIDRLRAKYCTGRGVSERDFCQVYLQCGQAPFEIVDAYMDRVFDAQAYDEMP